MNVSMVPNPLFLYCFKVTKAKTLTTRMYEVTIEELRKKVLFLKSIRNKYSKKTLERLQNKDKILV